jgi:hypothetical protein
LAAVRVCAKRSRYVRNPGRTGFSGVYNGGVSFGGPIRGPNRKADE